jgi:DNA polymerase-1
MIPEWLWNKTIAVWDIECDLIPSTEVYCNGVSVISIDATGVATILNKSKIYTQYWTPYTNGSLLESIAIVNSCDFHCGHNIVGYDVPMVRKILGVEILPKPLDTLILSKIIFSKDELFAMDPQLKIDKDLWGGYSLKAFGQRMGDFKLDFSDFSGLTEEMTIYGNQDVDLTAKLLLFLLAKDNFPIEAVVDIEHKAASIIELQTQFGFYLDITKARALNTKLLKEKLEIATELNKTFKPKWLKDGKMLCYKKKSIVKRFLPNPKYVPLLGTKI